RNLPLARDIYGTRINGAGVVLSPSGVALSPSGGNDKRFPRVAFDGTHSVVAWVEQTSGSLMASRVTPDLSVIVDTPPIGIATGATLTAFAVDTNRLSRTLIADTHFDSS